MVTVGGLCHALKGESTDETVCGLGGKWLFANVESKPTK